MTGFRGLPSMAVVVAVTDASPIVAPNLAGFAAEVAAWGTGCELVVVDGSAAGVGPAPTARIVRRSPGRLAPELWRDGIDATDADHVALSVGTMRPKPGWLGALHGRLETTGAAGVGGSIAPGPNLAATDLAVALLRYANYWPGRSDGGAPADPPGDNALYRRARLDAVRPAWVDGFWEVDVHRALREQGETLAWAGDEAAVEFRGGSRLGSMLVARWRHGRIYGRGRARGLNLAGRLARTGRASLVPPLLLARIGRELRHRKLPLVPWLRAGPGLIALASAWAAGEAAGGWDRGLEPTTMRKPTPIQV